MTRHASDESTKTPGQLCDPILLWKEFNKTVYTSFGLALDNILLGNSVLERQLEINKFHL